MKVKALEPIMHNGKTYKVGDVFIVDEKQARQLFKSNAAEEVTGEVATTEAEPKAEKNVESTDEKKKDAPEAISVRTSKADLLKIAADEATPDVEETMTNEEIRLAITKAREEKAKQQN